MSTDPQAADLVRIRPTLIIGLGGTGGDVILRVRKRFYEKFGSLAELPIVGYLWLDTDRSEKHIMGKEIREFVRLTDTERLMVTIPDTTVITQNLHEPQNSHIEKWWYPGLNALGQMNEGAGQIRAYSRLALMHHYRAIRTALTDANTRIRDPLAMERMMSSTLLKDLGLLTQVEFNQPTNIYLVCSIAGGTGSGMLMDMSFLVKDLFQEGNINTSAFLVFPDHFGSVTNEKMRANAYALLKELNYYQYGVEYFESEWSKGSVARTPIPPFDYCYLFDNQNAAGQVSGGQPGSQELIFELLADAIFKDFSHGDFADHKRSARINLRQYMNKTFDYEHPRFKQRFIQRYQSMGMATIAVPHARIITACAYRLAADIVAQWDGGSPFNPADLPRYVQEDFLGPAGLLEDEAKNRHDLLFGLLDTSGLGESGAGHARGLLSDLANWRQNVLQDIARGVPAQQRKRLRDFLDEAWDAEAKRCWAERLGAESEKWGYYPRTMRVNLDALTQRAAEAIQKAAFGLVDQSQASIASIQAVLREVVQCLKGWSARFDHKAEEMQTQYRAAEARANAALAQVGIYQNRGNWDGRRALILEHVTEVYLEAVVGDVRQPGSLRCLIQERLYREGSELCKRMVTTVEGRDRPDGRRGGGLLDQLAQLSRDLQALRDEFQLGYSYFAKKDPQPQSLVLYEATDVEQRYYPAYVQNADQVRELGKAALTRLGRSLSGLSVDVAGGRTDSWKRALLAEARRRFQGLKNDFHVVKLLFTGMDEPTRGSHLRQILARSAIWVTRSGLHGTFRLPNEQVFVMVGLPAPGPGMDPAEVVELEGYLRDLRAYIQRELSSDVNFYSIPETSEIIFYQEAGGFPVNYLARLADLRESYLRCYTAGEALHIERSDQKYTDLAILTKDDRLALEEAYQCYVLGCLFDILEYKNGTYVWMERDGFQFRPHPLGDRHMLLVKLAGSASTRQKLLALIDARRLEQGEKLTELAALLSACKQEAYGPHWGQVSGEDELPFDDMMAVRVLTTEEQRLLKIAPAEQIAAGLEELSKAPERFSRRREDGKLAILRTP